MSLSGPGCDHRERSCGLQSVSYDVDQGGNHRWGPIRQASQLYLSLGDPNDDGSIAVRLYHKPLVLLIWLGAVVMFIGGGLSLSDRRLRIGAPKPASKPAMQPAE